MYVKIQGKIFFIAGHRIVYFVVKLLLTFNFLCNLLVDISFE